ncbi:MAG TPA: UvrD-helicase domain-containing protein [Steroidobacteraceae bacterium]|jgi:ATP-dependent exoDNAse (exonuclease V) beta subunit
MSSDAAARAAALDPRRSFIVQAPAGSGKTELLTQRYLRLLANVEAPEQILAITFTRKAAAEMRQRILLAFAAAADEAPQSPHKRITWDLARAVREKDARHSWHLAQHPSRLRIQTIDALNAALARRLPMLAATGAALQPTNDASPLYEAACRGLIERLGDGSAVSANLEALIVHLGNRVDRLAELLSGLLAKRDQWLHPVIHARASENLRAVLEDTLRGVVDRHLAVLCKALGDDRVGELLELIRYSAGNLLANDALAPARKPLLESCAGWSSTLDADSRCLSLWRGIATMLFKQDGDLYASVSIRQGFPTTNQDFKARMQRMLKSIGAEPFLCEQLAGLHGLPDVAYAPDQWRIVEALLEVLPQAVAELQLAFQSHGEADYVEIALRALRALGTAEEPTDLALAFDYRLQHILVDEFQDTSFAQLDLLERLTGGWDEGDGRTLFCVGDPMQSIYRFRQAEVGLFLELQQRGLRNIHLEPLRLTANFRSAAAIVDWLNRVFPAVLASQNDPEQGAVKYSPSVASVVDRAGQVHVHASVNADDATEATRIVAIVSEALQRDDDGNIAILVPTRTRVDAIARALTLAAIDFDAVEIEQLRDRPVVQDLIALTRALVHLGDRTAWLAVLRAPWCALTLADLHVLAARDTRITIDEALKSHVDDLSADGRVRAARTYDVLSAALTDRGRWPLRTWVERTWNALGGPASVSRPQDLDNAEAFFRRLEEIETAGDLEDVARLEAQLDRLFAHPRPQAGARVELMTIHAAKGLEFDTVILPGLHRWTRPEDKELLRWTRIVGPEAGMVLAPIKAQGGQADSIYRWIELLERQRVLRERARLLYVAATRAKRDLHLLGNAEAASRDNETALREPRKGSMLRLLWHAVAADFEAAAPASAAPLTSLPVPPQKLRRLPVEWTLPVLTPTLGATSDPLVDIAPPVPFDWVTHTSRHVGTLVHRELDRMSRTPEAISVTTLTAARARLAAELAELGVPVDRCESACDRVITAIEQILTDPRGRWLLGLDRQVREAQSELALSGVINGRVIEGIIDRTFVDEHGRRWIVDFKTSTHEGGGLDEFLAAEVERYRSQLLRYSQLMALFKPREKVHAALYFPLLRIWKEVDLGLATAKPESKPGAEKVPGQLSLL